ncbi:MAG: hypothetical protein C4335_11900 [Armatimonadota bacterium]
MKRWFLFVAIGALVLAWQAADAQSAARRGGGAGRQPGNIAPQGSPVPEAGTLALFASGTAPVLLYALKRYRQKR